MRTALVRAVVIGLALNVLWLAIGILSPMTEIRTAMRTDREHPPITLTPYEEVLESLNCKNPPEGVLPRSVVYRYGDSVLVGNEVAVGTALSQIFEGKNVGWTSITFCKRPLPRG